MKRIYINDLNKHFNEEVEICAFVDNIRNLQWVQFVILRDKTGKVQLTIEKSEELNQTAIYYLCKYIGGEFGTGDGPEFNNDPAYADSGKFIPEIVTKENLDKIPLVPPTIKEKFIKDVKNGKF